jgi:hypothetical protein
MRHFCETTHNHPLKDRYERIQYKGFTPLEFATLGAAI